MKTKHGASKLTFKDVEEIRTMFSQGMKDGDIATIKGVSRVHINRIRHGKRWNAETWEEMPKVLITEEKPQQVKSNDFREFTYPKVDTLTSYQQNRIQNKLDGMADLNNRMMTDEFQMNYHIIKFIEALTGRKPKKVSIEL